MSRFLYTNSAEVPRPPNLAKLSSYVEPVANNEKCSAVLERFFADRNLFALPVVNKLLEPVALIERHSFVEFFGLPFTRDIHGKKSVLTLPTPIINHKPIVVDVATTVDDVAQIIIDGGTDQMLSGFIISCDRQYYGISNEHGLLDEITQRRQAELYALAHYDQLTGLPNRRLFLDRIQQACLEANRAGFKVAVVFIDVDRFKQINDNLGHAAGDHLLQGIARRLAGCARDSDTVARLGGDEFGIVMEGIKDISDTDDIARRIVESMKDPVNIAERELFVTVSVGIAVYPVDDDSIAGLLTKADAAMYMVKNNGRNGYKFYVAGFTPDSLDSMSIEAELRTAVANNEFVLHYQPQVDLGSGIVQGVEALIRWQHPKRGLLSPAHFIAIAEQSRLIIDIGYWVIRAACLQQQQWVRDGSLPLKISVNVSTLQFQQPDFCRNVRQIIDETEMNPAFLELEMTESIMMHHGNRTLETLNELKALGVSLALDDFGTGFSSLSYLRQFPIDRLKIDQSFVRMIEQSGSSESIVRAISALGKSLSMMVIAEGIETVSELDVIRSCSCDSVQGYLFSKPIPSDELVSLLKQNSWSTGRQGVAQDTLTKSESRLQTA